MLFSAKSQLIITHSKHANNKHGKPQNTRPTLQNKHINDRRFHNEQETPFAKRKYQNISGVHSFKQKNDKNRSFLTLTRNNTYDMHVEAFIYSLTG